jgi:hypothetical protein
MPSVSFNILPVAQMSDWIDKKDKKIKVDAGSASLFGVRVCNVQPQIASSQTNVLSAVEPRLFKRRNQRGSL